MRHPNGGTGYFMNQIFVFVLPFISQVCKEKIRSNAREEFGKKKSRWEFSFYEKFSRKVLGALPRPEVRVSLNSGRRTGIKTKDNEKFPRRFHFPCKKNCYKKEQNLTHDNLLSATNLCFSCFCH